MCINTNSHKSHRNNTYLFRTRLAGLVGWCPGPGDRMKTRRINGTQNARLYYELRYGLFCSVLRAATAIALHCRNV